MNTKYTRVVVTLFLAIATLATMGFRAPNDHRRSLAFAADVTTCELVPTSLTAIELLDLLDEPCYSDLVDRVETEIGWSNSGQLATDVLLDSIFSSASNESGMTEYLAIIEQDTDTIVGPSISPSARSGSRFEGFIDYHNPSSPWADAEPVASVRSGARFEGFIDYHNPSSPWADAEPVASARSGSRFEGFIDYHNPSSPWADAE